MIDDDTPDGAVQGEPEGRAALRPVASAPADEAVDAAIDASPQQVAQFLHIPVERTELPTPDALVINRTDTGMFVLADERLPADKVELIVELARLMLALEPEQIPAQNDTRRKSRSRTAAALRARYAALARTQSAAMRRESRGFTSLPTGPDTDPDAVAFAALRTDRAHIARTYDYLLGGADHYPVDRDLAEQVITSFPAAHAYARDNRAFLHRAVHHLAEQGIDQFLDLGTGVPLEPNLHQIAQAVNPAARVVYLDNDPLVLAQAAALLTSDPRGQVAYVHADVRHPVQFLLDPDLSATLDFSRPVAICAFALLHWLDDKSAAQLVRTLMEIAHPGSYLALSHASTDLDPDGSLQTASDQFTAAGLTHWPRTGRRIREMFLPGLEPVGPGLTTTTAWRPDGPSKVHAGDTAMYAVLAAKTPASSHGVISSKPDFRGSAPRADLAPSGPAGVEQQSGGRTETRGNSMTTADQSSPASQPDLLTDRAHSARIYDYLLGGKDNYLPDREAAEKIISAFPNMRVLARSNRAFMRRSAQYMTGNRVQQFIDIGTGIPTQPNLHQIVQAEHPSAKIVYVDNDPIVLAHAAALMTGTPEGIVEYVNADARSPELIVESEKLRRALDLTKPVGISAIALLHWLDDDAAAELIRTLVSAVPSGSLLSISHGTLDADKSGKVQGASEQFKAAGLRNWARSRAQIEDLFLQGLELVDPGIVFTHRWRPDQDEFAAFDDADIGFYGLVARKP